MDPRTPAYWNQVYLDEPRPGWDMDGATPLVEEVCGLVPLAAGASVAVPGCGFGHDAAEWARRGFRVTGFDFAPLAVEGARERYGDLVEWRLEDWFETQAGPFDAVFDHTCFVAMEPRRRAGYVARVAELLGPGGLWLGAFFHDTGGRPGPPFAIEPDALRRLAEPRFEILRLAPAERSHPRRAGREFLMAARKR